MRGDDRRWLAGLAIVMLLAGGCTDRGQAVDVDGDPTQEFSRIGEPGVDRAPFPIDRGVATAAGDDLVVISGAWPPGNRIDAAEPKRPSTRTTGRGSECRPTTAPSSVTAWA